MDEPWVIYRSITSHPHLSETSTEHHWCMLWYIWIVFLQSSSFSDLWNMVWNFSLAPNVQFICKNSLGITEVMKNQKPLITYNKSKKKIFWQLLHMQKLRGRWFHLLIMWTTQSLNTFTFQKQICLWVLFLKLSTFSVVFRSPDPLLTYSTVIQIVSQTICSSLCIYTCVRLLHQLVTKSQNQLKWKLEVSVSK